MWVVPDLVKSAVHVPGENEHPSTWHTHLSVPPPGDPLMYGRDFCIPWSHGDMERCWKKGDGSPETKSGTQNHQEALCPAFLLELGHQDVRISSPWCFLNSSLLEEPWNLSLK